MPAGGQRGKANEESEWGRLRRNRPLSVRSALLLLALLALLAADIDAALYASVADHYQRHGHIGVPLDLAGLALGFTALAVYAGISVTKELRKRRGSRHSEEHDTHAGRGQSPKEPP